MRWKWFQRAETPIDVVQAATIYQDRAGAYSRGWNAPTQAIPVDRPLLTRAGEWRARHATRRYGQQQ